MQKYKNTRIQEYKNTRIQEYKNTRIQGYKNTRLHEFSIHLKDWNRYIDTGRSSITVKYQSQNMATKKPKKAIESITTAGQLIKGVSWCICKQLPTFGIMANLSLGQQLGSYKQYSWPLQAIPMTRGRPPQATLTSALPVHSCCYMYSV